MKSLRNLYDEISEKKNMTSKNPQIPGDNLYPLEMPDQKPEVNLNNYLEEPHIESDRFSVDDFIILDTLGKGAYGIVVRTIYKKLKTKEYALKIMDMGKYRTNKSKKTLLKEFKIHSTFNHANIVNVMGYSINSDSAFLLMELCESSLENYLSIYKVSIAEATYITKNIAMGIEYIHSSGYAHRDLKPDNVVKCRDLWKIMDFGFIVSSEEIMTVGCCTPLYMAPEVLECHTLNHGFYDPSSFYMGQPADIWALGLIFRQMIMGEEPYKGASSLPDVYRMIQSGINLKTKHPVINDFISKTLEIDPTKRVTINNVLNDQLFNQFKSYHIRYKIYNGVVILGYKALDGYVKSPMNINVTVYGPTPSRIFVCGILKDGTTSVGSAYLHRSEAWPYIEDLIKIKKDDDFIYGNYVDI